MVEFQQLNDFGRIECQLANRTDWQTIASDQGPNGWVWAPLQPAQIGSDGSLVEARLSPIYISPGGKLAVAQIEFERISTIPVETTHFRTSPTAFRLESGQDGGWVVTGRTP